MSANARNVARHYTRIISRWPKDPLRPQVSLPSALEFHLSKDGDSGENSNAKTQQELRNVNALYSLLGNRYKAKYPVSESFMRPTSNPDHYVNMIAELDAAPNRSWLSNWLNSWKGYIRLK